jgi:hypothetical protein
MTLNKIVLNRITLNIMTLNATRQNDIYLNDIQQNHNKGSYTQQNDTHQNDTQRATVISGQEYLEIRMPLSRPVQWHQNNTPAQHCDNRMKPRRTTLKLYNGK